MYRFPIGIITDSFRTDIRTALEKAAALGADGVQIYATRGKLSPEQLTPSGRKELLDMVKSNGLRVSALCGDLGCGFHRPERNPELIEKSKRILDLAKELETDIVTTHIGVVPADPEHPRFRIMQDACGQLAAYADSIGAHFAVETGPETSAVLKTFLDSLHSTGVGVNLDPANLVMVTGDDPAKAVYNLRDYIVHTHAKDGRQLFYEGPESVYGLAKNVIITGDSYIELPLGDGDVPWDAYLAALDDIGYKGFLTIEREVGDDPEADIRKAVAFLEGKIR
jgi:sugar phosphate isomerase/epimerase